jgi:ParB family chromosome partitioning protein
MELTAHRTLALRNVLAQDPQVAFLAALHAMVLRLFYRYAVDSCVEIEPRNAAFGSQVPGLGDTAYAQAIDQRHETWARNLPKAPEDLWEALTEFDSCSREALFAHCVAMSVNAVHDPYQRRPRAIAHADVLAGTVGLDMAKAGWTATGDSYLGRVTKARILEAVCEAKGEDAADRIAGLRKAEMVTAAEDLLLGTGWLPDPLRTLPLPEEDAPEIELIDNNDIADGAPSDDDPDTGEAQSAEDGGEQAIGESDVPGEDDPVAGDAFARTAAE